MEPDCYYINPEIGAFECIDLLADLGEFLSFFPTNTELLLSPLWLNCKSMINSWPIES
jgi:hypothetical protein